MKALFYTLFHQPLYNALVWFVDIIPGGYVSISIIVLTIAVKLLFFPLQTKFVHTQLKMRKVQGQMKEIQKKYKDDREAQGKAMLELYKKENVNPLSGFLLLIVQLPILIALLQVFRHDIPFHLEGLYSFVSLPEIASFMFFSIDLTGKSILLALLVAISQYIQIRISMPSDTPIPGEKGTFQADFAKSMQVNMKYTMPVIIGFISYGFPAALSLYWITNNVFTIFHEVVVKKRMQEKMDREEAGKEKLA